MTSGFPQGQYFYIKSKENGSCIDVYMGETTVSIQLNGARCVFMFVD